MPFVAGTGGPGGDDEYPSMGVEGPWEPGMLVPVESRWWCPDMDCAGVERFLEGIAGKMRVACDLLRGIQRASKKELGSKSGMQLAICTASKHESDGFCRIGRGDLPTCDFPLGSMLDYSIGPAQLSFHHICTPDPTRPVLDVFPSFQCDNNKPKYRAQSEYVALCITCGTSLQVPAVHRPK